VCVCDSLRHASFPSIQSLLFVICFFSFFFLFLSFPFSFVVTFDHLLFFSLWIDVLYVSVLQCSNQGCTQCAGAISSDAFLVHTPAMVRSSFGGAYDCNKCGDVFTSAQMMNNGGVVLVAHVKICSGIKRSHNFRGYVLFSLFSCLILCLILCLLFISLCVRWSHKSFSLLINLTKKKPHCVYFSPS